MFCLGLGLFTLASVACVVAPGLWWLVAFRVLQAVGVAALTPTSIGLLPAAVPPAKRMPYVRIWTAVSGLAASAGPVLGGLLVTVSWRWVFLVNLPVGILGLVAAVRVVPDSRDANVTKVPDMLGAAVLTAGIGMLALAIVKGGGWGWSGGATIVSFTAAAVFLAVFLRRAEHHPLPVVEPDLYRVRSFAAANVAMFTFSIGMAGHLLLLVLWLQNIRQWSIITTGLAVVPGPAAVPLVTVLAQRLAHRVQPAVLPSLGCLAFAAGIITTLTLVGPHGAHYARELLPGQLLFGTGTGTGTGIGLTLPALLASASAGLPPHRTSTGSGVINMTRQIGFVVGVSLVVAIIGTAVSYAAAHSVFVHAWWTLAGIEMAAAIACLGMLDRRTDGLDRRTDG